MAGIFSILGARIGIWPDGRTIPYWAVKLKNGKFCTELDMRVDRKKGIRAFDWSDDLVANGDIFNVTELWMFCPPNPHAPAGSAEYHGQRARLPIVEPGTAFQFKVATVDVWGGYLRRTHGYIIGRVDNKITGDCTVFIWDALEKALYVGQNNLQCFKPWKPSIGPIQHFSRDNLGLRLS